MLRKLSAIALLGAVGCAVDPGSPPAPSLPGSEGESLRAPEVQHAHAESSPPLRLLPNPPEAPELEDHPVRHNPNLLFSPALPDPVLQRSPPTGPMPMPAASPNFLAQGNTNDPMTVTGTPPDTNGAVGPNHYVQMVNGGIAVWDKSGNLLLTSELINVIWANYVGTNTGNGCSASNDGDPVVVYDSFADRWVVSQFQVSSVPKGVGGFECVAVSQTGDPTGAWNLYDFKYTSFPDYPKLGVWSDAYYATFNGFATKGNTFKGAILCAMDRNAMIAGQTATQVCFPQTNTVFGVLPAELDGKISPPRGEPGFFVNFGSGNNTLNLWKMHVDFVTPTNSTLSTPTSIPVASFTPACNGGACIPQPSPGVALDSLADRLMFRLAYRNYGSYESLVVNHSVTANGTSGLRWYEIHAPNGTPTIAQQGTYAPNDGLWRWMGSVAEDQAEDFALGFSASSGTKAPEVVWTGRLNSDALNTMGQAEAALDTGKSESTYFRWGDYSDMTVDPVDDCTFWYTQELYNTQGEFTWDTYVASAKFPTCAQNDFSLGLGPASQSVAPGHQVTYMLTSTSTKGTAESVALSIQDLPPGLSGSFNPASITAGGSSTLTVTAAGTAGGAPATPFTVVGKAKSAVHAVTAQVAVSGGQPSVSITNPSNGTTVGGIVTFQATATAAGGTTLSSLTLSIDGAQVSTGASPQSYALDTTLLSNGTTHTLTATAKDADNGTASASVSVTVKNNPTVAITAPTNGATVSGRVSLTSNASAPLGTTLSALSLSIDGTQVSTGTSPQSYAWDTTTASEGAHTLVAFATDADGTTASAAVSVTVANPPSAAITAPVSGSTVMGTVTVTGTGTSANATTLASLALDVDGVQVQVGTSSPQNYSWDTTKVANGMHTLTAVAVDMDGPQTTSPGVTVTVNNPPPTDAGSGNDAGSDAGSGGVDAGPQPDGGTGGADAGAGMDGGGSGPDAGSSTDAGAATDAGSTADAGSKRDAGGGVGEDAGAAAPDAGGGPGAKSGCGCSGGPGQTNALWFGFVGLALVAARRRRRV